MTAVRASEAHDASPISAISTEPCSGGSPESDQLVQGMAGQARPDAIRSFLSSSEFGGYILEPVLAGMGWGHGRFLEPFGPELAEWCVGPSSS